MFHRLSEFAGRYRISIAIIWVAVAVTMAIAAPPLSKVGITDESQFLPQDTESAMARTLLSEKFAKQATDSAGSALIVFYQPNGLGDDDFNRAQYLRLWLNSPAAPAVITSTVSIFDAEQLKAKLVSSDNTTMLMTVNFSASPMEAASKQAVDLIRQQVKESSAGTTIYVSGEAGLYHDLMQSVDNTISRTTLVAVLLVAILLLLLYRSPVAALLPLITIGCSFLVARGILGYMAAAGVPISTLADAYLVVTLFGVGTDYCFFIVSRFREELRQKDIGDARNIALTHIGPVIAASAVTVIVAFLSLGISRFGMNTTTGYALAIGVAITLLASLTLTPALMALFGRFIFWPAKKTATHAASKIPRFGWNTIGHWVTRHPLIVALPVIALLLVPYLATPRLTLSANVLNQMPQAAEAVQGFNVMREHFQMGEFVPLYLLVQSEGVNLASQPSLTAVDTIARSLQAISGIASVDYYSSASAELATLAEESKVISASMAQGVSDDIAVFIQNAGQMLLNLPLQYPSITGSNNFNQCGRAVQQEAIILGQISQAKPDGLAVLMSQLAANSATITSALDGLAAEFKLEGDSPFVASLLSSYFSTDKSITRINLVLSGDPYSQDSVAALNSIHLKINSAVENSGLVKPELYLGGELATRADILKVNEIDFGRVAVLATIGILLVIIILLRCLVAPLYMVITVLLNYGATLGILTWLVLGVMKYQSIIYMVPLFIFIFLVALGADYNIFLMSRIREEARQYPVREAVKRAITNTGGVINACGIILAGTFAILMLSPMQVVFQIGAAITLGVLLDTFLVRALVVPALAVIFGRFNWWPGSNAAKEKKQ